MRVVLVNAHGADLTAGGGERYVADLAAGLSSRGHRVTVVSAFPQLGDPEVDTRVLHKLDWRDSRLRRIRNHAGDVVSTRRGRLDGILADLDPELVHTHNLPGIGTGIWEAARRARIPVVHTLHDHYLLCPRTTMMRRDGSPCNPHPLLCGARTRRLARWSQAVGAVVGPSDYILRAHRGLFGAAPEHLVPLPLKCPAQSPTKPPAAPPATLGYVGALTAFKGIELLLSAAPRLAENGFTVRVAGDGPLRREVETAPHVSYEGWLRAEERDAFMASCDCGLVPSLNYEASSRPYVACEWLAAGRPVVATRRGGLIEAAGSGGVIAFDASPVGLVETVLGLRAEDEWKRLLSTLPVVDDDADLERWVDEHEMAYEAAATAIATLGAA